MGKTNNKKEAMKAIRVMINSYCGTGTNSELPISLDNLGVSSALVTTETVSNAWCLRMSKMNNSFLTFSRTVTLATFQSVNFLKSQKKS